MGLEPRPMIWTSRGREAGKGCVEARDDPKDTGRWIGLSTSYKYCELLILMERDFWVHFSGCTAV